MIELVRNIRLEPAESLKFLPWKAARKIGLRGSEIAIWRITRRSLDARKKSDIHYIYSVEVSDDPDAFGSDYIPGTGAGGSALPLRFAQQDADAKNKFIPSSAADPSRPVIVGFGPAGMFAGLTLARAGLRPIILERGQAVEERSTAVERFRKTGFLDPESNAQFGEGGAGTFSDGKLNTGTHDGRIGSVLLDFYRHGAPESVLYDAKPHIGTDVLTGVVRSIREEILALGGEIFFNHRMEEPVLEEVDGSPVLKGVRVSFTGRISGNASAMDGDTAVSATIVNDNLISFIPCTHLILATGHSARDTYEALNRLNVPMERKAFSMGVRIEHLQSDIDRTQYGRNDDDCRSGGKGRSGRPEDGIKCFSRSGSGCSGNAAQNRTGGSGPKNSIRKVLPAADYSLSVHLPDGSSAYTFCMCPGGYVFAAASEEGGLCTNGMSYSGRSGTNANSALLVTLHPGGFPGEGVLAGMYWQREIERKAFQYSQLRSGQDCVTDISSLPAAGSSVPDSAAPPVPVCPAVTGCPSGSVCPADFASCSGFSGAPADALPLNNTAYRAPCQTVGDFLANRASTGPGKVLPTYLPGVVWGDLRQVLPEKITSVIAAALPELDCKLPGFASPDAVLTGPETRSSSPVRILRDSGCASPVRGLYPCGEGAGYAGGITSAAVDGIRCAEAVMQSLKR